MKLYDTYAGPTAIGWLIILAGMMLVVNASALYHTNYNQGIPRVHQGSVIYVQHLYDKWNDYDWTKIEILTYSGNTNYAYVWGHVELDIGTNYKIHTVRDIRRMRMFPYMMRGMQTVVKLEVIDHDF